MRLSALLLVLSSLGCAGALELELPPDDPDAHPRVREARARVEAAIARAGGAGSLDDPMLFLKAEAVPLRTPGSLQRDDFNAVGVSQSFPLGKLGLRADVAAADARRAHADWRRAVNDVSADARKALADWRLALREKEIHDRHAEIMKSFIAVAETKYTTGKVSQQDVLEGQSGASMIHVSLSDTASRIEEARVAVRELTGRDPELPPLPHRTLARSLDELTAIAETSRPELRAAEQAVARATAARDLASRERWWPDVTAELMYMQEPGEPDGYAATLGVNLPWFSPKRRAEAAAAVSELAAEQRAVDAVRRTVRREVAVARQKLASALRGLELFEKELVPRAEQTLQVARTNYESDKVDFLRVLQAEGSLRSVELEAARALAQVEAAWAELERATGTAIK